MDKKKDFFISYTQKDEQQALWIAGTLEKAEFSTIIQAWDFNAGENFIINMDNALKNSKHLIIVLSEDYLNSLNCRTEWTAAFARYAKGELRAIIPIKISEVELDGLLAPISYINLYKLEESEREKALIDGVTPNKNRIRPDTSGIIRRRGKGELPLNNLPHSRNPYFTGREEKLELIYNNFQGGDSVSLVQSLSGLGGVGKTSIALEFAYTHSHEYEEAIWCVNAENSTTALAAYRDFAMKKNIISEDATEDVIIEAMKYWFNSNEKWLFIYDNADSADFNVWLEPYLPQKRNGHVLITTRNRFFPKSKPVDIVVFNEIEAVEFLKKRTNKTGGGYSDESAKILAARLQYLPLALEQAAAYIVEIPGVTYGGYITLLEEYGVAVFEKKTLDETDFYIVDYLSIVTATWKISMDTITNESAKQMFNMCAYFAPAKIPVDMFIRGSETLAEPLQANIIEPLKRNDILNQLTRYSLLSCEISENNLFKEGRVLYIHRLLQEVVQKDFGENHKWLSAGLDMCSLLADWNPHDINSIQTFKTDTIHIEKIVDMSNMVFSNDNDKLRLLTSIYFKLTIMYGESFNLNTALNYGDKSIEILESLCATGNNPEDWFNLFQCYLNRESIFIETRDYKKAIVNIEKCIALGEKLRCESKFFNESVLATAYMTRGIIYEYLSLYEKALIDKNKSIEIKEHLYNENRLTDENTLALAYMNRGVTYKSMKMYRNSLDDTEKSIEIWTNMKAEGKQVDEISLAKAYLNKSIHDANRYLEKNEEQINKKARINIIKGIMAQNKKPIISKMIKMDEMGINFNDAPNTITILEEKSNAGNLLNRNNLVQAYKVRGLSYMKTGCHAEADEDYNMAFGIIEDMRKNGESIDENTFAEIHACRGILRFRSGQIDLFLHDIDISVGIWESLKSKGIPIDEAMFNTIQECKAMISPFKNEDENESLDFFNERISAEEKRKKSNQPYDRSELANNYYFIALNNMKINNMEEAIVNFSNCIETFLEIDMNQIDNDDLKILSSSYLCRGELYFSADDVDASLDDYNRAVNIEELLQKNGVEMNDLDILDIIRLYTGRAGVLDCLGETPKAISDFITALRLHYPVFDEHSDIQDDYYFCLSNLIDCLIEENAELEYLNEILQEFLFSLINTEKTSEAEDRQNNILNKLKDQNIC
ncbi:MAG: toll/interleukin-1 receptor domain-containing protein [Defluviitaleaceae bacterium]|nr:toll/interleukin-1 receptor domain-containing protein [Defluviitaleaceae bacterium]